MGRYSLPYSTYKFRYRENLWKKIDFTGIILLACFLGCALAILEEGRRADWFDSILICSLSIVCFFSFILFIYREINTKFPVVDLTIFKDINFLICYILVFIWGIIIFASGEDKAKHPLLRPISLVET